MDKVCPNVDMKDKRTIADKIVSTIKDHQLCNNKECFNVVYLCSCGEFCYSCQKTFCEECCNEYCEECDEFFCKQCYKEYHYKEYHEGCNHKK